MNERLAKLSGSRRIRIVYRAANVVFVLCLLLFSLRGLLPGG